MDPLPLAVGRRSGGHRATAPVAPPGTTAQTAR
jgi:hypothetical protein